MTESMTRLMRGVMTMGVCVALSGTVVWAADKPVAEQIADEEELTFGPVMTVLFDMLLFDLEGAFDGTGSEFIEARAAWNTDVSATMSEFLQALSETEWSRTGDARVPRTDGPRQGANTGIYVDVPLFDEVDGWAWFLSDRYVRPHWVYAAESVTYHFDTSHWMHNPRYAKYMLVRDMTPRFDPYSARSKLYRALRRHWEVCGAEPMTISMDLLRNRRNAISPLSLLAERVTYHLELLTGYQGTDGASRRTATVPARVLEDIVQDTLMTCGLFATLGVMQGTNTSLLEQEANIMLVSGMIFFGAFCEQLRGASEENETLREYTDLLDLAIEIGNRCRAWRDLYAEKIRMERNRLEFVE